MLKNKTILIGITAGIAAYKIYDLIRLYKKNSADVIVIVTPNALNFVNKLTLQTLSNNKVYIEPFETVAYTPEHIAIADRADIFVIAPATANTIAKLANGICDNLLTSVACAFKKTFLLAPSMNTGMWENSFVQDNIKKLSAYPNYKIIQPEIGYLACGTTGAGRMTEPDSIFERTLSLLNSDSTQKLKNKKILVTAGGTKENIDPVRYIGNYSSGKMGKAIADVAHEQGADVTLITTVDEHLSANYATIKVSSALEMKTAVEKYFPTADCLIMSAAVADYRPMNVRNSKTKKNENSINLELVKNPDILEEISQQKQKNQTIIGFCAETEDLLHNAKTKIQRKNCDFIVANDISQKDITFGSDYNEVFVIDKDLNVTKIEKNTKISVAHKILEFIK